MKTNKKEISGAIIIRLGKRKYTLYLIGIDYFNHEVSQIYRIITYNERVYDNVQKFATRILKKRFKNNAWYKDKSICWKVFTNWDQASMFYNNIKKTFSETMNCYLSEKAYFSINGRNIKDD